MTVKVESEGIKILAPFTTPSHSIQSFLDAKQNRIQQKREMMQQRKQSLKEFRQGSQVPYLGENFVLNIELNDQRKSGISFDKKVFTCTLSKGLDEREQEKRIALLMKKRYTKQASIYIRQKVIDFATQSKLSVDQVLIKSYRAKYGQCSGNDVYFSYKIIQFPPPIIHHVILHELAHIKHKNHGSRFWSFLEKFDPQTKAHVKRLREHGVMLD